MSLHKVCQIGTSGISDLDKKIKALIKTKKDIEKREREWKGVSKGIVQLPFYAAINEWAQSIEKLKTLFYKTADEVPDEIPPIIVGEIFEDSSNKDMDKSGSDYSEKESSSEGSED